jgi:hypothetical protein
MKSQGRMLAAILVLVFVAGLVAAAAAVPKGKTAGKTPKLVIEQKTAQLGQVLEGQDHLYTFTLKNVGDAEAQILSVKPG